MKKVRLSDVLTESSILSESPNPDRRIRVRLNVQGIEKRPFENSVEGATNYYTRKAGQFIYGKQNLFKGAFGIIPQELDGFESSSDLPSFDISEKCFPAYLLFYFQQGDYYKTLESIAKGGASKRISPKNFLNLEIPLPNLTEQETIVQKIKGFMAIHSEAKAKIEALQTDLKAYRKSILQEAIKGNLTAAWRANNPTEKIDLKTLKKETTKKQKPLAAIKADEMPFGLPQNWSWVRLGDVCELSRGRFSARPRNDPQYFEGEYPFIQIGSLDEYGSIVNNYNQSLNEKGLKVSKMFSKGTIMIAIVGGTIGNLGVLGREMCFPDSIIGIEPDESYNQDYILLFLRSQQSLIRSISYQKSGQPNIKIPVIANLLFPLPPLTEQAEIVRVLEEKMATIVAAEGQLKALLAEQSQLQKSMMQEVFRG